MNAPTCSAQQLISIRTVIESVVPLLIQRHVSCVVSRVVLYMSQGPDPIWSTATVPSNVGACPSGKLCRVPEEVPATTSLHETTVWSQNTVIKIPTTAMPPKWFLNSSSRKQTARNGRQHFKLNQISFYSRRGVTLVGHERAVCIKAHKPLTFMCFTNPFAACEQILVASLNSRLVEKSKDKTLYILFGTFF